MTTKQKECLEVMETASFVELTTMQAENVLEFPSGSGKLPIDIVKNKS